MGSDHRSRNIGPLGEGLFPVDYDGFFQGAVENVANPGLCAGEAVDHAHMHIGSRRDVRGCDRAALTERSDRSTDENNCEPANVTNPAEHKGLRAIAKILVLVSTSLVRCYSGRNCCTTSP